jgi:hypothetical protein
MKVNGGKTSKKVWDRRKNETKQRRKEEIREG